MNIRPLARQRPLAQPQTQRTDRSPTGIETLPVPETARVEISGEAGTNRP